MYSNVHATIGTAFVLGTYSITKDEATTYIVGGLLGFLSHHYADKLGEAKYPNYKEMAIHEGIPLLLFFLIAFLSDLTGFYLLGMLSSNLMDLIDKKAGLSLINGDKYPFGSFFPCHRKKPLIDFDLKTTKILSWSSLLLILIFYVYELVK